MSRGMANKPEFVETTLDGKQIKKNLLIAKYYEEVNPDMSFADFQNICKTPFRHIRSKLSTRVLYEIRFKYFGRFSPKPNQLVWLLHNTKERYDNELIDQKTYNATVIMITDYVSHNVELFTKFKDSLKPWIEI